MAIRQCRTLRVDIETDMTEMMPTAEMLRRAEQFAPHYPAITRMLTAGCTQPFRVSDVLNLRSFWGTEMFECMHGHGGRFPTAAALAISSTELVFLGLHRQRRDFSDQDVADLAVLQQVISPALAYRAALNAAIAQLDRSMNHWPAEGSARDGWVSQDAVRSLCRDFQPSRREAEVLCLVTAGWTDRQIARRLGITVSTVRKHLTEVFDKAGVRGRAAVAAWWQHTLDTEPTPKR
jgi:DNA-binding NarL/FixJ family response regulator